MSFIIYDLILLAIFVIFIGLFLYRNKKNLKKEGLLFLYKTKWGIKLINYVGNKYKKTLKFLSYVSVFLGYLLMIGIIYLVYTIIKIYILRPDVVSQIKVPPIMPLIPYIDKVVPFLPPFYFTYWIVILAVIAITHEFSHGIFAAYNKVKIKKTGFGFFPFFLPVFLAAFVELDEKKMIKKSNFGQRAILSAGTFANIITAILFFIALVIFFMIAFTPAGVAFDDYTYTVVSVSSITSMNGVMLNHSNFENITALAKNASFNFVEAGGRDYIGIKAFSEDKKTIALYDNAPAINSGLNGPIIEINNIKIDNLEKLSSELSKYSPGETVPIKTKVKGEVKTYDIKLGENPENKSKPWLGIGFVQPESKSLMNKFISTLSSFRKSNVYYEPKIDGINLFVYNLLWWLVLISFSVALVNMLPVGIFDGGRFFYLTVLAITKSEKAAKRSFVFMTYLFLLVLLLLMVIWGWSLIR